MGDPTAPRGSPHRSVLLRHDLPDGTHHFDWLIDPVPGEPASDDRDDRRLWTLRLAADPFGARGMTIADAVPLLPHRVRYLTFEGPISGGRGAVRRVRTLSVRTLGGHARPGGVESGGPLLWRVSAGMDGEHVLAGLRPNHLDPGRDRCERSRGWKLIFWRM